MKTGRILGAIGLMTWLALAPAAAADKWLHVRVAERGARGDTVHVNLPLSIVERVLPLIEIDELHHGTLDLSDELDGLDLLELARALRDAPDADFVTVESPDETVRVTKEGDFLIVHAQDRKRRSAESVRVRMPLALIEALVGDDSGRIDLMGALRVLEAHDDAPLVDVESDDTTIRVWIDTDHAGG